MPWKHQPTANAALVLGESKLLRLYPCKYGFVTAVSGFYDCTLKLLGSLWNMQTTNKLPTKAGMHTFLLM